MSSEAAPARVLLVGQGPTAASALSSLLARHQLVGLVRAAPDGDPVVLAAHAAGAPVHGDVALSALHRLIVDVQPDCVVVSSYDRVLPPAMLGLAAFVNVHYSPLPRYRGRANVNWAIINGEDHAAISVHTLVPNLDAGGVLFQETVPIGPRTTATDLYATLNALQHRELGPAVSRRLAGEAGVPQDEAQATYGCTRTPEDGELDWGASTDVLDRLVRGLTPPAPGAFTYLGLQRLWVDRAEPAPEPDRFEGRVPGRVSRVARDQGWVDVLSGDGVLRLHDVRLEDGTPARAADVVRSVRATLGLRTTDLLAELRHLRRLSGDGGGASDPGA